MDHFEKMELLKAALALAVADGDVRRCELGVLRGLAKRMAVGEAELNAMLETSQHDDSFADNILIRNQAKAHTAFELLVAQARIDGEISVEERELLVRIAKSLKIDDADFPVVYSAGVRRRDSQVAPTRLVRAASASDR